MKNLLLVISLCFSFLLKAQIGGPKDCVESKRYPYINLVRYNNYNFSEIESPFWQKTILPLAISATAISINRLPLKQNIQDAIRAPFNGFTTHVDDYIQYTPVALMYGADIFKLKAKHSVWNQTKFLFLSEVSTSLVVLALKYSLKVERPDGSSKNSFPSGHTAQSFVAAHVLYKEFRTKSPILAYSGYLTAFSTGTLRMVNNRHWLPDVLLGAGIGILMTNLVYHFEPFKDWTPHFLNKMDKNLEYKGEHNRKQQLLLMPTISTNYMGFNFKLKL